MNITIIRANALGTPRVAKTAKVLTEAGHSVKIVRWERQIRDDTNKYTVYLTNVKLISIKTAKARSNAFYRSLIGRMGYLIKVFFFVLLHRKETDIFHCVDFDSAYPVYIASLFNKRIQYNYDIADYLQDYDTKAPQFIKRIISTIDKSIRKRAIAIFVPHISRMDRIEADYINKTYIVNNAPFVNINIVNSTKTIPSIDYNKINILYYGVLSKDRGIEFFLNVAKRLSNKYNFYIAGTGSLLSKIIKHENIYYLGELKYLECMAVLSKMDLCYTFYDPTKKVNRNAAPNKFYEAVLFNIPIIAARHTGIDLSINKDKLGFITDYSEIGLFNLLCDINNYIISEVKIGMNEHKNQYSFKQSEETLQNVYSINH